MFNEKRLGASYGTKMIRDNATGSPVIEIGYTQFAVPEEVDMVTYQ